MVEDSYAAVTSLPDALRPRNLGHQASSTTSGAPTSTSTGTSSNSDGNGSNDPNGIFSPSGSPPLILAFLAVGLFVAAMIAVFGWRRLQFGRAGFIVRPTDIPPGGAVKTLGEKPQLWDLWAQRPSLREYKWENVTPFSARTAPVLVTDMPPVLDNTPPALERNTTQPIIRYLRTFRNTRQHQKDEKRKDPTQESMTQAHLQVAIAIAMPSPPSRSRDCNRDSWDSNQTQANDKRSADRMENVNYDGDGVEYSIGIIEVPWEEVDDS